MGDTQTLVGMARGTVTHTMALRAIMHMWIIGARRTSKLKQLKKTTRSQKGTFKHEQAETLKQAIEEHNTAKAWRRMGCTSRGPKK